MGSTKPTAEQDESFFNANDGVRKRLFLREREEKILILEHDEKMRELNRVKDNLNQCLSVRHKDIYVGVEGAIRILQKQYDELDKEVDEILDKIGRLSRVIK